MYMQCKFCENPPSGFWDSARRLPKIFKTSINEQFKIFLKSKNILAILFFAYIAHAKFQKASFNSNREQNIRGDGGDGGDGDGTQNNTSRRFQKRAGGKKHWMDSGNQNIEVQDI